MTLCIAAIDTRVDNLDVFNLNARTLEFSSELASNDSLAPPVCCLPWRPAMDGFVPIVEVAFGEGMYWSMPFDLSAQIYNEMLQPVVAQWTLGYTWAWGREGEVASCNRYLIDVDKMTQRNMDTHCERAIRVVWVQQ